MCLSYCLQSREVTGTNMSWEHRGKGHIWDGRLTKASWAKGALKLGLGKQDLCRYPTWKDHEQRQECAWSIYELGEKSWAW